MYFQTALGTWELANLVSSTIVAKLKSPPWMLLLPEAHWLLTLDAASQGQAMAKSISHHEVLPHVRKHISPQCLCIASYKTVVNRKKNAWNLGLSWNSWNMDMYHPRLEQDLWHVLCNYSGMVRQQDEWSNKTWKALTSMIAGRGFSMLNPQRAAKHNVTVDPWEIFTLMRQKQNTSQPSHYRAALLVTLTGATNLGKDIDGGRVEEEVKICTSTKLTWWCLQDGFHQHSRIQLLGNGTSFKRSKETKTNDMKWYEMQETNRFPVSKI